MHKMFGDWYRKAKIEPNGEWLPKRWQGVENFIQQASNWELLEQVRLFRLTPVENKDFLEKYLNIFQTEDHAFPMTENRIELSVLAGAGIAEYLENSPSETADALALASVCIDCCQLFSPIAAVPDITRLTEDYLKKRSELRETDASISKIPEQYQYQDNLTKEVGELEEILDITDFIQQYDFNRYWYQSAQKLFLEIAKSI